MIIREQTPDRINAIANDPRVLRAWSADKKAGDIDLSPAIADPGNFLLMGERGGVLFVPIQRGVYEAHPRIIPHASGSWMREMLEASIRYMFTKTDAYELCVRIPASEVSLKRAVLELGMHLEFTNLCTSGGELTRVNVYAQRIQDWARHAAGMKERGQWLQERLGQEAERIGIEIAPYDNEALRYLGVAVEFAFGGQYVKAVNYWNRYISLAGIAVGGRLQHVSLMSVAPVVIKLGIGLLKFHSDDIELLRAC